MSKTVRTAKQLQQLELKAIQETAGKLGKTQRELSVSEEGAVEMSRGNLRRKVRLYDN